MGNLRTYGTLIGPVKGHSVRSTDIDEQVCMAAVTTIAAFQMIDNLDLHHVVPYDIGSMDQECNFCHALGRRDENRGGVSVKHFGILCCNKGQIKLGQNEIPGLELPELPRSLMDLYTGQSTKAKYFRDHIRHFNSGMALASMTFKNKEKGNATLREGMPGAFKVCGQL